MGKSKDMECISGLMEDCLKESNTIEYITLFLGLLMMTLLEELLRFQMGKSTMEDS